MKRKLIYLLPFAIMALSSCLKSSDNNSAPAISIPSGTFSGQFMVLRRNGTTNKIDTSKKTNLILAISSSTGYKITGDTTVNHAGSYGDFTLNYSQVQFIDKTYPASGTLTNSKAHLYGVYDYAYDGTTFIVQHASGDTVAVRYVFKKTASTVN